MSNLPVVLFGACDRHNLGDLLFPHLLAARYAGRPIYFAGLVERDLSAYGGHRVVAIHRLPEILHGQQAELAHVGGELLTCDAYTAAVMLQTAEAARAAIRRYDALPAERAEWAAQTLATLRFAPYVLDKQQLPWCVRMTFHAVGGVALADCSKAMRDEVFTALHHADAVTVRDRRTLAQLEQAGIDASLQPDAVTEIATQFAARIREHAAQGEVQACTRDFPQGYLAVQFAAEYGDDATLDLLARGIASLARERRGVMLFCAGAAPWHDELGVYQRLAQKLAVPCRVFESLNIWDICALIAGAQGYLGSSLHGYIVARAYGVPAVGLEREAGAGAKLRAWCKTWDPESARMILTPGQLVKLAKYQ